MMSGEKGFPMEGDVEETKRRDGSVELRSR